MFIVSWGFGEISLLFTRKQQHLGRVWLAGDGAYVSHPFRRWDGRDTGWYYSLIFFFFFFPALRGESRLLAFVARVGVALTGVIGILGTGGRRCMVIIHVQTFDIVCFWNSRLSLRRHIVYFLLSKQFAIWQPCLASARVSPVDLSLFELPVPVLSAANRS